MVEVLILIQLYMVNKIYQTVLAVTMQMEDLMGIALVLLQERQKKNLIIQ